MNVIEPSPEPRRPKRRWHQHTPWTILVGETPARFQFSLARLLGSFVFFAMAFGSPAVVAWHYDPETGAWALWTAGLLLGWIGAAVGLLRAGIRGAIAGALTCLILLLVVLAGVAVGGIIHLLF